MTTPEQQETLSFQAEVKQLLHLVTHALYSNKEIFLRELISNASDAADKLRFEALGDSALFENDPELKIHISFDKEKRTITIKDNGIGMNREEVIENLGTIAKSGTREFLSRLSGDQAKDSNLIGQFGVGFYSGFVVADQVIVKTRRAGMTPDQGVYWESTGGGDYIIKNIERQERGTEVILHLRTDEDEFLDDWRLRGIITKYSDHILLPIVMEKAQVYTGEEEKKTETTEPETEVVNRATALWTLPKSQIKDEEYRELYKHIAHDFEEPLLWSHNRVEGKLEYISLLFIPGRAPFDMWNRERRHGLKLYVHRVFIMDDAEQLLPSYLRFVRGIVDSNDLPLNVSREILQSSHIIDSIRTGSIKRVLDMLDELAKNDSEKYAKFWSQFGQVLKEGPGEDYANRERIARLLRFASTHNDSSDQNVSFADYVSRMPEEQKKIYYVTAETYNAAKHSPHLEIFRKKGIEVLLLSDRVDEWLVSHLTEFEGKPLQSVAKGDLDLGGLEEKEAKEKTKQAEGELASVITQIKNVLSDKVKEVRLTDRLTDSPACLVADEQDMSIHLQNLLRDAGQNFPASKPIFEINPDHPLVIKMKDEADEARFADWTWVLFEQAQLAQGSALEDPANFVRRLNALLVEAK
ncbi:MAG TPA: molecular chaperone HtpG [Gammaproteobacteria bacterium]|nr:molecular chaperone HtpG [Gammaproteobacteria bacterium]